MVEIINVINWDLALSTLGSQTALLSSDSPVDANNERGFRISKIEYWLEYKGKTTDEGPIWVGFTSEDAAGVKTALQSRPTGITPQEKANAKLPVWPVALIPRPATNIQSGEVIPMSEKKLNWSFKEGEFCEFFAFNCNESSALTTGTILHMTAKIFGVWLND